MRKEEEKEGNTEGKSERISSFFFLFFLLYFLLFLHKQREGVSGVSDGGRGRTRWKV